MGNILLAVFVLTELVGLADVSAPSNDGYLFRDGKGMFNRRIGMFVHWGIYSAQGKRLSQSR